MNLWAHNLSDHTLPDATDLDARRCGLTADDIELEITESAVMMDLGHGICVISQLRERVCHVAIDDVRVSHSSLAHLQKIRASAFKIG